MLIKSKRIEYIKKPAKKQGEFVPSDYVPGAVAPQQPVPVAPSVIGSRKFGPEEEVRRKIAAAAEEAYARGLAEGTARGADAEKKKLASTITAFENALLELARLRENIYENLQRDVLDLALDIAEKVIHREVQTNHEIFLSVLKEAVRNILDRDGMKIRLNPRDYEFMLEVNPGMLQGFEGIKNPQFEKDDSLARGDVVVETMFGEVDARIDSQLDEIKSALTWKG